MFSVQELCSVLTWGLQHESASANDDAKMIRTKEVSLLNDITLVCEFSPYAQTSIDIKAEIAYIMGFLSAFFKDNPLVPGTIQHFAVRAYSSAGEELLSAISSKQTAEYLAQGRSIEWLQNTLFQENSADHRVLIAKKKIAEIENTLREVIGRTLSPVSTSNWWLQFVKAEIRKGAERAYRNQNGAASTNGEELISYTYLPQLETIITDNWSEFSRLFPNEAQVKNWINSLNKIRRDEAHNRSIASSSIATLEQIYADIMEHSSKVHPDLTSNYLTDNWRQRITAILADYEKATGLFDTGRVYGLREVAEGMQRRAHALTDVEARIGSIPISPGKRDLHNELLAMLANLKSSFQQMAQSADSGNSEEAAQAFNANVEAQRQLRIFHERYLWSEG